MSCQTSYTYLIEVIIMENKIGVMKEIDRLGRIVIPKEMRDTFKLDKIVEILVTPEGVLIRNPRYEIIEKKDNESSDQ